MTDPIEALPTLVAVSEVRPADRASGVAAGSAVRQGAASSGRGSPVSDAQQPATPSAAELTQATQDISDFIQSVSRSLQISVDGDLGTTVIRVLDSETDELVRQIPAEEILQVARFIEAQSTTDAAAPSAVLGLLVDQEG